MASTEKKIGDDVAKLDLYHILGVSHESTEKMIVKAYRKKALKCHPDKNPDNPAAIEMFHQLSKALEILTDNAARAAYDKVLKARKAAELRMYELDSKRRKLREDLEAREKAAAENQTSKTYFTKLSATEQLEAEILRLRKEGKSLLQQEQERLQQELKNKIKATKEDTGQESEDSAQTSDPPRLKLKWKAKKSDLENGGYSKEKLEILFSVYGKISALLVSNKKNGSAVIEFEDAYDAMDAFTDEKGLKENPLTVTWLSGQPRKKQPTVPKPLIQDSCNSSSSYTSYNTNISGFSFNTNPRNTSNENVCHDQSANKQVGSDDMDFESLVFMRLRQAQERKKLAEKIAREQDEEEKDNDINDGKSSNV